MLQVCRTADPPFVLRLMLTCLRPHLSARQSHRSHRHAIPWLEREKRVTTTPGRKPSSLLILFALNFARPYNAFRFLFARRGKSVLLLGAVGDMEAYVHYGVCILGDRAEKLPLSQCLDRGKIDVSFHFHIAIPFCIFANKLTFPTHSPLAVSGYHCVQYETRVALSLLFCILAQHVL